MAQLKAQWMKEAAKGGEAAKLSFMQWLDMQLQVKG